MPKGKRSRSVRRRPRPYRVELVLYDGDMMIDQMYVGAIPQDTDDDEIQDILDEASTDASLTVTKMVSGMVYRRRR